MIELLIPQLNHRIRDQLEKVVTAFDLFHFLESFLNPLVVEKIFLQEYAFDAGQGETFEESHLFIGVKDRKSSSV